MNKEHTTLNNLMKPSGKKSKKEKRVKKTSLECNFDPELKNELLLR